MKYTLTALALLGASAISVYALPTPAVEGTAAFTAGLVSGGAKNVIREEQWYRWRNCPGHTFKLCKFDIKTGKVIHKRDGEEEEDDAAPLEIEKRDGIAAGVGVVTIDGNDMLADELEKHPIMTSAMRKSRSVTTGCMVGVRLRWPTSRRSINTPSVMQRTRSRSATGLAAANGGLVTSGSNMLAERAAEARRA